MWPGDVATKQRKYAKTLQHADCTHNTDVGTTQHSTEMRVVHPIGTGTRAAARLKKGPRLKRSSERRSLAPRSRETPKSYGTLLIGGLRRGPSELRDGRAAAAPPRPLLEGVQLPAGTQPPLTPWARDSLAVPVVQTSVDAGHVTHSPMHDAARLGVVRAAVATVAVAVAVVAEALRRLPGLGLGRLVEALLGE